jgi:hypothetical protein
MDDSFQELNEAELEHIDEEAVAAFESGLYSIAVFLNEFARAAQWRLNKEKSLQTLEYQLSARAGIRGQKPLNLKLFADGLSETRARAMLHVANHESNTGNLRGALKTLQRAQELLEGRAQRRLREDLELDVCLRRAQITRSAKAADEAIALASAGSIYRQHTAHLFAGMIAISDGSTSSREHFEVILSSGQASWLYRAECWFARGLLALVDGDLRAAYRDLSASQYVYAVLGLQPTPHPALPLPAAVRSDCLPVDLLLGDPRFRGISETECLDLRIWAIEASDLRNRLFRDLAGRRRPRDRYDSPNPLAA